MNNRANAIKIVESYVSSIPNGKIGSWCFTGVTPWSYAEIQHRGIHTVVGASSNGLLSIDGDPFGSDGRVISTKESFESAMGKIESMCLSIQQLKGANMKVKTSDKSQDNNCITFMAGKAAAILAFTSGVEDFKQAVTLYDLLNAQQDSLADCLDKINDQFPGVTRWSRVEALNVNDWWEEVRTLALNFKSANSFFQAEPATIYVDIQGGALQSIYGDELPDGIKIDFVLRDGDNIDAGDEDPLPEHYTAQKTYW